MNTFEIVMLCVGLIGMCLILYGVRQESRYWRQIIMPTGAGLLGLMSAFPKMHPVFFSLQLAICSVGFINIKDGNTWLKNLIIFSGAVAGSYFAIQESVGIDTWVGIIGLVGMAFGYAGKSEEYGGNQFLFMGIGGIGMVAYSVFGIYADVWQAWPFFLLNIPFSYWGLRDSYRLRKRASKNS